MSSYTMANPQTIISNLDVLSGVMADFGIFMGLMLCLLGFFQFKRSGESRTMMSGQMTVAQPIITTIAGIMMMSLAPMVGLFSDMFLGTPDLIAYTGSGADPDYNTVQMVVTFVRVVGLGAMMNAFMKLSRTGGMNTQKGEAGKALMFLVGGIMCLNCVGTLDLIMNLFDLPSFF